MSVITLYPLLIEAFISFGNPCKTIPSFVLPVGLRGVTISDDLCLKGRQETHRETWMFFRLKVSFPTLFRENRPWCFLFS